MQRLRLIVMTMDIQLITNPAECHSCVICEAVIESGEKE